MHSAIFMYFNKFTIIFILILFDDKHLLEFPLLWLAINIPPTTKHGSFPFYSFCSSPFNNNNYEEITIACFCGRFKESLKLLYEFVLPHPPRAVFTLTPLLGKTTEKPPFVMSIICSLVIYYTVLFFYFRCKYKNLQNISICYFLNGIDDTS